jgi:hypothetical protein
MKRLSIAISIAALALPLCAQDKPNSNTTTTVLAQPPAEQSGDSPLVRAAKATQKTKTKKGSIVITNDTLLKSGGHIFVANPSTNPPLPPLPSTEKPPLSPGQQVDAVNRAKAEADAAKGKKDKETPGQKEQKVKAAAADYYGESIEERVDDPAAQEHVMNQMTSTQPQTVTPSKPPQE